MSKKANTVVIGGFVVGAIVLVIMTILVFGSGKFFQRKTMHVMFFEGSVKGLAVGAPVKFRGVDIGMVKNIQLTINPADLEFYVPVYVEIFENRIAILGGDKPLQRDFDDEEVVDDLVEGMGLRAQLQMQSLLTGQLFINYDFYPDTPIERIGIKEKIYEIPTIPTTLQMFTETVTKIINDLRNVNFKDIVTNLSETAEGVKELAKSEDLRQAITEMKVAMGDLRQLISNTDELVVNVNDQVEPVTSSFEQTLADTRQLVNNIDSRVEPIVGNINETLDTLKSGLGQAESLLKEIKSVIAENSYLSVEIVKALETVSAASRSVQDLAEYLQRHPEAFIKGKK
jgi:paraquat-inducible protein B